MNCTFGLANRLFYFSHCLALGEATGHSVVSLDIPEAGRVLGGRHGVFCVWPKSSGLAFPWPQWVRHYTYAILLKFLARWLKHCPPWLMIVEATLDNTRQIGLRDPEFLARLRSHRIIIMRGWPAIEDLEFPNPDTVRAFWNPGPGVAGQARDLASQARGGADVLIGVHCRWGDYTQYGEGCFFYPVESYARVMHHLGSLFPGRRVAFLVVTDEPDRLDRSSETLAGLAITRGSGTIHGDLFGLAECDYIVCPASSFSLWAAFYGRKPLWCMTGTEALPDLPDFVVPGPGFAGMHPERSYRHKEADDFSTS